MANPCKQQPSPTPSAQLTHSWMQGKAALPRKFIFDRVFGPDASQKQVFEHIAPAVDSVTQVQLIAASAPLAH